MRKHFLLATSFLALTASTTAYAQGAEKPLKSLPDNALIVLAGSIGEIRTDEFDLIYSDNNTITVELDRFGWQGNETKYLIPGEAVTVQGFIDDDFFEGREIEAYDLMLENSFVHYYTSDNPSYVFYTYNRYQDGMNASITGTVLDVRGHDINVRTDHGDIVVNTDGLGYDPFDNDGLQKIENGDRIWAFGKIDDGFFDGKTIIADGLYELNRNP